MGQVIERDGFLYWNNLVNTYIKSDTIIVDKKCFGYQATNTGDTICKVNNILLYPGVPGVSVGDTVTVMAHEREIYRGNLDISFNQPVGVAPSVQIIQLIYMVNEM